MLSKQLIEINNHIVWIKLSYMISSILVGISLTNLIIIDEIDRNKKPS